MAYKKANQNSTSSELPPKGSKFTAYRNNKTNPPENAAADLLMTDSIEKKVPDRSLFALIKSSSNKSAWMDVGRAESALTQKPVTIHIKEKRKILSVSKKNTNKKTDIDKNIEKHHRSLF
jgi:hypothetical protein